MIFFLLMILEDIWNDNMMTHGAYYATFILYRLSCRVTLFIISRPFELALKSKPKQLSNITKFSMLNKPCFVQTKSFGYLEIKATNEALEVL